MQKLLIEHEEILSTEIKDGTVSKKTTRPRSFCIFPLKMEYVAFRLRRKCKDLRQMLRRLFYFGHILFLSEFRH